MTLNWISLTSLNAAIPDGVDVFVEQPHGFKDGTCRVCRLKRALYGLTRSPRWRFDTLTPAMKSIGFEIFDTNLCLFRNQGTGAFVLVYVDDLLIAGPDLQITREVGDQLGELFYISQHLYIDKILHKSHMKDPNGVST